MEYHASCDMPSNYRCSSTSTSEEEKENEWIVKPQFLSRWCGGARVGVDEGWIKFGLREDMSEVVVA